MKSWSLGRKSGKRETKERNSNTTPARPKSMVITSSSVAGDNSELLSSVQASPSLAFPSADLSSSSLTKMGADGGDKHKYSASRYLSSAQLKDQARREIRATPSEGQSSRQPLSAKTNVQSDSLRTRTSSLPSLMKAPSQNSAVASSAALSPTAAVARGTHSSENRHHHQQHQHQAANIHHDSNLSASSSMRSIDSFYQPPSPTRTQLTHDGVPRTRLTSITSELPSRKNSLKSSPKASQDKAKSKVDVAQEGRPPEEKADAIASLRRLKGADDILIDARQLDNVDSMSVLESRSSIEEAKEVGRPIEDDDVEQDTSSKTSVPDEDPTLASESAEQAKYSFAIRKSKGKGGNNIKQCEQSTDHNFVRVEAKLNLAIQTNSPTLLRLRRDKTNRGRARLLITAPIPSLLGCDRLAGWAVERVSRLTSCVIQVFGS